MADPQPTPPQPSPDYSSRVAVIVLAIISVIQGLYTSTLEPVVPPLPSVEQWYVTSAGEVIEAPEVAKLVDSLKAGDYELVGYPKSGKISRLRVVIGGGPQPIPPTPEPPSPPQPPIPVPPVPPVDVFAATVQTAYSAEVDANKASVLKGLIAGYSQCQGVIQSPNLATLGQLYPELRKTVISYAGFVGLPKTRGAIADEINAKLPTDGGLPLTPELRAKIAEQFKRAQTALEAVR